MRWLLALLLTFGASAASAGVSTPGLAGGEIGDRLVFVGDSLTLGVGASEPTANMPARVSALFGGAGRRFKVLGVQGAMAPTMRDAVLREKLQPADVVVIWLGRIGAANPETLPAIREITAHVPGGRYLVLSVIRRVDYTYEQPGTRAYEAVTRLNADLASDFGDHFVVVGEDVGRADHSDEMNLNDHGYAKIAKTVFDALTARGW
jgi:lysophospholipase L1-like esterase